MIRPERSKAKEIAYAILGKPDSMRYRKTKRQRERDEALSYRETPRYR